MRRSVPFPANCRDAGLSPFAQAIDRRSAQWLEDTEPEIFHAIAAELAGGATVDDVVRVVQDNGTQNFVRLVRSAARWLDVSKSQT